MKKDIDIFGSKIDKDFDHCLKKQHSFSWETISESPKEQRSITLDAGRNFLKPMNYHILHGNGFIRLATTKGRVYWLIQNSKEHGTPDWKFHISVSLNDLNRAWNIIAAVFMESRCEIGMKITTGEDWPISQYGREITIYCYIHCSDYEKNYLTEESKSDPDFRLGKDIENLYSTVFWYAFLTKVDKLLKKSNIINNGKAVGDLELPGLDYVTLRNESFVNIDGVPTYPPNSMGYNPTSQRNPFLKLYYFLKQRAKLLAPIVDGINGISEATKVVD